MIVSWGGRDRFKDGKNDKDRQGIKRGRDEISKRAKVLWVVPVVYGLVAGVEAVLAGSVVGLMYVCFLCSNPRITANLQGEDLPGDGMITKGSSRLMAQQTRRCL